MKNFLGYLKDVILKPGKAFEDLLEDPDRLKKSVKMFCFIGVIFAANLFGYYIFGLKSAMPIIVAIIPEKYFFLWCIFAGCPAIVFFFIMTGGTVQLFSELNGGKGSFEDSFSLSTYSLSAPLLFYWIVELSILVICIFTGIKKPAGFLLFYMTSGVMIAVAWSILLLIHATEYLHRISRIKSFIIGSVAGTAFWLLTMVFMA